MLRAWALPAQQRQAFDRLREGGFVTRVGACLFIDAGKELWGVLD